MPGKRHTTEQKIRILREADQVGKTVLDVCCEYQISEQTFHRWKREFGMLVLYFVHSLPQKKIGSASSYTRLMGFAPMRRLIWQRA